MEQAHKKFKPYNCRDKTVELSKVNHVSQLFTCLENTEGLSNSAKYKIKIM